MKRERDRHALAWLRNEPGFAALGEQARRLVELQADLRRCLPGLAVSAVSLERGVLVVGSPHAAVAAKIRQFEPTLLAQLGSRGWVVSKMRFRAIPVERPPPRVPKRPPPPGAIADVAALATRVRDPRLGEALRRLAQRHEGR